MPRTRDEKSISIRFKRVMLMRDAIIYNRNNPSVLFYETGNNQVSEQSLQ